MLIKWALSVKEHAVIQLSVHFSDSGAMVWEVVTPAAPPSDRKHQNIRDSEPQGEYTDNHKAAEFTCICTRHKKT